MKRHRIIVMPGDGIGPEVTQEACRVLLAVGERFGHAFDMPEEDVGGTSLRRHKTPIRGEVIDHARQADAILFGAVGDPEFDRVAAESRPERAILELRQALGLFANLRPVRAFAPLAHTTPLQPARTRDADIVIVRELTGGIYFGRPRGRGGDPGLRFAVDTMRYEEHEIVRILHVAFRIARNRRRLVTSVDKANVLATSALWREVATEVASDYPDVRLEHQLVDSCAMDLVRNPARFDVVVTENMFGDILSDEAACIAGSLGMAPSASLGAPRPDGTQPGLYEPIHGSAPDIAGRGIANPLGTILSAALLLRHSLGLEVEASAVESAVEGVLASGLRTADLADGSGISSTAEMGGAVCQRILESRH